MSVLQGIASLPSPIFEGSEKRLEVDFIRGNQTPERGLRCLPREKLDQLCDKAECCIVSHTPSEFFDAYVLSESSLFVYPTKLVLKTCGNTKLLSASSFLLELAAALHMTPARCKYSRASYLFPELQPDLYRSFARETSFLEESFGHLGESGSYVLGDDSHGLQWHIYIASVSPLPQQLPESPGGKRSPTYTLEVCMTELDPAKAAQFVRTPDFVSAKHTTSASGIGSLLPAAHIDDYVFEPCGYSMNGIEGSAFSTIHVTPEDGWSYASLELCGYPAQHVDPTGVVAKAVEIFKPGRLTVSLSVDQDVAACKWPSSLANPSAYTLQGINMQHFPCGGCHHFYSFTADKKPAGFLDSPSTVLDNIYRSATGDESDRSSEEGYSRSSTPALCEGQAGKAMADEMEWTTVQQLSSVLKAYNATVLDSGSAAAVEAHMMDVIAKETLEDPLYIVDLGRVARLYKAWTAAMPRVTPYYAVKCLPDKAVVSTLAALGAGFDCASEAEVRLVLDLGVSADRIILANCCKRPRDLRCAAAEKVQLTTFDTMCEVEKLAKMHPGCQAVLRIRADDPGARCPLGNKYGADPAAVLPLLQAAKDCKVNVVGVSFHVGSAATDPAAFEQAICMAGQAFQSGTDLGFNMTLLDIGGGFSSGTFALGTGDSIPAAVTRALELHFPHTDGLRIISEPGRYFTEEAATLACMIIGVRPTVDSKGRDSQDYYIPDGLYGSMNSLLYDHAVLEAHPLGLAGNKEGASVLPSTVFGPTCDGLDSVLQGYNLPVLEYGDWLVFPNMGAYTLAGASDFNGMGVSQDNVAYAFSLSA